jgi:hypothetical protein
MKHTSTLRELWIVTLLLRGCNSIKTLRKIKKGVQILSDLLEILVNNKEQKDKKMIDYLKH